MADRRKSETSAVQFARLNSRARRADAGCASLAALVLVVKLLDPLFESGRSLFTLAAAVALVVGLLALCFGDGRVANTLSAWLLEARDD